MDEQRFEDYWSLIQELLSCPSGEESEILQRHSNLVDEGLVRVMGYGCGVDSRGGRSKC
jgi:hypothetical protein